MTRTLAERQKEYGDTAPLSSETPGDGRLTPPEG
jgi:hypothetical protein